MRTRHSLGVLATVITMLVCSTPSAQADETGGGAIADAPTLSLADLGSSTTISLYGRRDVTSTNISFQVPEGLSPVALNASVELPVKLRSGTVAVKQGNRVISKLELPADDGAPIVIPLVGTQVYGDWVNLTLTATTLPPEGYCWDPQYPMRLTNGAIAFTGTEALPTTVAAFLPSVLRRLTIGLPAKPSQAESDAAVHLATAMARRYGGQNPDVVLVPLADGASALGGPSGPLERQIIVKEGPDKGLSLQGGPGVQALLIAGTGNELTNQTRQLSDSSLQFALSPKVVAGQLVTDQKLLRDITTLEEMNRSGLNSEALWPEVGIELDQTGFGHSLGGVRVHLMGSYTPLPDSFGGEVRASARGETIGRWPADSTGTIDQWVDIPDRLLKRSTTLQVGVRTTGDPGQCGDYLPLTLRIDGDTQIEAHPANPPVTQGLQAFPQALGPRVQVGIGADSFGDTIRAAQIMVDLQRSSDVPLDTTVTSLKQALSSSEPAVLVSADGWTEKSIALPFSADQGRITVAGMDNDGKPTTLNLDSEIRFGSLQTVFDGRRSLLIATSNGAPAQLDELLRWLSGERGRWSGLDGRAIVALPGAEPVTIPNPPVELSETTDGNTQDTHAPARWAAGGVVAVAAIGAAVILSRARRGSG